MQPSGPPSAAPGGSFRVDMEQAPDAIKELQSALDQLLQLRRDAVALSTVNPMSGDSVSADAARALGAVAAGGPGSLASALDAGIDQIKSLIDSMQADLSAYENSDTSHAQAFSARLRS